MVRELSRQLESWRALLPTPLQWSDEELYTPLEVQEHALDPAITSRDFNEVAIQSGRDILTAGSSIEPYPQSEYGSYANLEPELRTRFYYARYILYRPFVFKALHFPQLMNAQDEEYCAFAVGKPICINMPCHV